MKNCRSFFALRDEMETTPRLCPAKFPAPLLLIFLFAGFLLSGCIRDELMTKTDAAGRVLAVNYSFDDPQTRTPVTGPEKVITDVAVLFYNADDAHPSNETYVDCQAVTIPGSNISGSFSLPLPATILEGNKYRLIIIGNYKKYAPGGKSLTEYTSSYNMSTYSEMKEKIQGQLTPEGVRGTTPLPFWGKPLGADGNETTLTGPTATDTSQGMAVKFSRAMARFDVTNLAADQLKIAWVKVCNYRNKGYFFQESIPPGNIVRGTTTEVPGPTLPPGYIAAPLPLGAPGNLRQDLNTGGLYAFSNAVLYTSQDDKLTTCLMIAGYFKANGAADYSDHLTYYRANMSDNGSNQFLRRNYIYTLVINSVKTEGADTEEGAMNEKEQLLGYEVDDDWDSEQGSTVTGEAGDFLTLSRASVVLGSEKDESVPIKVAVKKGTGWTAEWKDNADGAFRIERVNDESFKIVTTGKNETPITRKATLTVSVTGISGELSLPVNVSQLFSVIDPAILVVEGKTGNLEYTVPGEGADISLQVITGSPDSQWKIEADSDLSGFIKTYIPTGANKGFINLSFNANMGLARSGILTVKRLLADGNEDNGVASVYVFFKQAKSPYVVSLLPNYSVSGLTIEGFTDNVEIRNGIAKSVRFSVSLADPENYHFDALCSFNQYSDAFITKTSAASPSTQAGPLQTSKRSESYLTGSNGQDIWLNVFRTGPGDPDITGYLTVRAIPIDPASNLPKSTYSVSITIKTSCKIGDSRIGTVLWPDRYVGAVPRGEGTMLGLNYSYDINSDNHINKEFIGRKYTYAQAPEACRTFGTDNNYGGTLATGWRLPSKNELSQLAKRMLYSKGRRFIISDDTDQGTVGCWFPLVTIQRNSKGVESSIYSSETYSPPWNQWGLVFTDWGTSLTSVSTSSPIVVRCVR